MNILMQRYVAYFRVSTQKQGRSGLGLDAQKQAVSDHLQQFGGELIAEFMEVESGKRPDRPEFTKAADYAELSNATLLVAKLDRLSRDLHFDTGEFQGAQVFVAVMGGSNYTFAEASLSQQLENWVMSHVRAFQFFGAVPDIIVPDNLRSATTRACKYDPDLNPTYQQLAAHYNVAIIPARPLRPKDKAKAENGVLIVERWIMAVLRHETFYTLTHLNQRISELLTRLNNKPFQKLPGNRTSEYHAHELPAMRPLPLLAYQYTFIKKVKVNVDYHIEVKKHYYSVPYGLLKRQIEAHVSEKMVKLYYQNQCVAQHLRSERLGGYSTQVEHMPKAHQEYAKWSPERLKQWANKLGENVLQWVEYKLDSKANPQQSYKVCFGLLSLNKTYPKERLNAACQRALDTGGYRLENIKIILKKNLDQEVHEPEQACLLTGLKHDNVRGQGYYH